MSLSFNSFEKAREQEMSLKSIENEIRKSTKEDLKNLLCSYFLKKLMF